MLSRLLRMGVAAAAMAAVLALLSHGPLSGLEQRHGLFRISLLGLLVATGMLTYAVCLQLLGVVEMRGLPAKLAARLRRRDGAKRAG